MWTSCYKVFVPEYSYSSIKEFLESDSGSTDKPSSAEDPWEDSGTPTASGKSETTQPTKNSSKVVSETNFSTVVSKNGQLYEIPKPSNKQAQYTPVSKYSPSHYQRGQIQVWDFISDQNLDFLTGNVVKYVCRAGLKDYESELDDLLKAKAYIEKKIAQVSAGRNQ